jgi:hypothetical protein
MMRARTLGLLAIAAFFLTASSAAASQTHAYCKECSFGGLGAGAGQLAEPAGVAVNDETHDVYVADTGNRRVDEFDPSKPPGEQFVRAFGTEGSGPGQFETPTFIAIDNSASSASKGDVYVGDKSDNLVTKFTAEGVLVKSWGDSSLNGPAPQGQLDGSSTGAAFTALAGIAVDSSGVLDVLDASSHMLSRFEQDGTFLAAFEAPRGTNRAGLTVDGAGEFFKVNGNGSVEELSSSGGDIGQISPEEEEGAFARGLTASGSDLYIVEAGAIQHYALTGSGVVSEPGGATCTVAPFAPCHASDSFGAGHLSVGAGVAVDSASGVVFAADATTDAVDVFTPVVLPNVLTGAATEVSQSTATLAGTVEPEGAQVISCGFEYGLSSSYGYEKSCSTPLPFTGATAIPQTAALESLQPNQTYHYRLSARTAAGAAYGGGTAYGEDQTFITQPAAPSIDGESVSALAQTTATLNAGVNPNNQSTTYRFEYGAGSTYGQVLPASEGEVGSGYGNVVLGRELSGLSPGTTYHFRVVATNATGIEPGPDRTFTTPPLQSPLVSTEAAQNVGQNSATLVGGVETQGFETTYEFDLGTDTSYGTRIFGDAGPVAGAQVFAVSLAGLTPGTTYHYRILATNTFGTVYGTDHTFTTSSYPASILLAPVAPAFVPAPSATAPASTVRVKPKPKPKPKKKQKKSKKRTASHGKGRK